MPGGFSSRLNYRLIHLFNRLERLGGIDGIGGINLFSLFDWLVRFSRLSRISRFGIVRRFRLILVDHGDGGLYFRRIVGGHMLKHILLAGVVVDGVGFDVRVRTFLILIRIMVVIGRKLFDQLHGTPLVTRRLGDDIDMHVVERRLRLHPQMRRLRWIDFGMLSAAMIDGHDPAVIRAPLVGAHAEQQVQLTLQRNEESACGARIAVGRLGG